jgi:hypothetical protein
MRILVRLSSVGRSTQTAQFDEAGSRSVAEAVEFRQLLMRLRDLAVQVSSARRNSPPSAGLNWRPR